MKNIKEFTTDLTNFISKSEIYKFQLSNFDLKYTLKLNKATDKEIYDLLVLLVKHDNHNIIYAHGGNGYNAIGRLVSASSETANSKKYIFVDKRFKYGSPAIKLLKRVRREHLKRKGLRVFANGNLYVESQKYLSNLYKRLK